jgi:ATP-dependent DNA helicase RecQ
MAERRPRSLDEFAEVNGVGAKKLAEFGAVFLKVMNAD